MVVNVLVGSAVEVDRAMMGLLMGIEVYGGRLLALSIGCCFSKRSLGASFCVQNVLCRTAQSKLADVVGELQQGCVVVFH